MTILQGDSVETLVLTSSNARTKDHQTPKAKTPTGRRNSALVSSRNDSVSKRAVLSASSVTFLTENQVLVGDREGQIHVVKLEPDPFREDTWHSLPKRTIPEGRCGSLPITDLAYFKSSSADTTGSTGHIAFVGRDSSFNKTAYVITSEAFTLGHDDFLIETRIDSARSQITHASSNELVDNEDDGSSFRRSLPKIVSHAMAGTKNASRNAARARRNSGITTVMKEVNMAPQIEDPDDFSVVNVEVQSAHFSVNPAGTLIAYISTSKLVLKRLDTGHRSFLEEKSSLDGISEPIINVHFIDNTTLMCVTEHNRIILDCYTAFKVDKTGVAWGPEIASIVHDKGNDDRSNKYRTICVSQDSTTIAVSGSTTLVLLDRASGFQPFYEVELPTMLVSMGFTDRGDLSVVEINGAVSVLDYTSSNRLEQSKETRDGIFSLDVSCDNKVAVVASKKVSAGGGYSDVSLQVYDTSAAHRLNKGGSPHKVGSRMFLENSSNCKNVAFNSDGTRLAVLFGGQLGRVEVYNTEDADTVKDKPRALNNVQFPESVAWRSDGSGNELLVVASHNFVKSYSLPLGETLPLTIELVDDAVAQQLEGGDNRRSTITSPSRIQRTGSLAMQHQNGSVIADSNHSMPFCLVDGCGSGHQQIAAIAPGGASTVNILNLEKRSIIRSIELSKQGDTCTSLALDNSGATLAVGTASGKLLLFKIVNSEKVEAKLEAVDVCPPYAITVLAFDQANPSQTVFAGCGRLRFAAIDVLSGVVTQDVRLDRLKTKNEKEEDDELKAGRLHASSSRESTTTALTCMKVSKTGGFVAIGSIKSNVDTETEISSGKLFLVGTGPMLNPRWLPLEGVDCVKSLKQLHEIKCYTVNAVLYRSIRSKSVLQWAIARGRTEGANALLIHFPMSACAVRLRHVVKSTHHRRLSFMRGNSDSIRGDVTKSIYELPDVNYESVYDTAQSRNCGVSTLQALIVAANEKECLMSYLPFLLSQNLSYIMLNFPLAMVGASNSFKLVETASMETILSRRPKEIATQSLYSSCHLFKRHQVGEQFTSSSVRMKAMVFAVPDMSRVDLLVELARLSMSNPQLLSNDALNLVIHVLWLKHIRRWYRLDLYIFFLFFCCWTLMLKRTWSGERDQACMYAIAVAGFNTLYTLKQLRLMYVRMSRMMIGYRRDLTVKKKTGIRGCWQITKKRFWNFVRLIDFWNSANMATSFLVFALTTKMFTIQNEEDTRAATDTGWTVSFAVWATMSLTIQSLAYLRGFKKTGWLIAVLTKIMIDARGFALILAVVVVGFSVAFTALLGRTNPERYDHFIDSILATYDMSVNGNFEQSMNDIYKVVEDGDDGEECKNRLLSKFLVMLLIFIVTIVALNALIALLGDSYSRIQERSTANMRKERALTVVEYLDLMPAFVRVGIEKRTRYFHKLEPADEVDNAKFLNGDDRWGGTLKAIKNATEEIVSVSMGEVRKEVGEMRKEGERLGEIVEEQREVIRVLEEQNREMSKTVGLIYAMLVRKDTDARIGDETVKVGGVQI
jgi:WD40 repeat protein